MQLLNNKKIIRELCKGVYYVDRGESFQNSICTQFGFDTAESFYFHFSFRTPPVPAVFEGSSVSQPASQPRTSPVKRLSALRVLLLQIPQVDCGLG